MKTIYLNANFECSVTEKSDTEQTIQTDFFDGKCDTYIAGMRFVPAGQSWTREDGVVFEGEMITPWWDSRELDGIQRQYERAQYAEAVAAVDALLLAIGGETA